MLRPTSVFLVLLLAASLAAQTSVEQRPALPADELTPAQLEQLKRDKLIIGSKDYQHIFIPYRGKSPEVIRFVTSDAALAAYHALFEESFRELELSRAARLRHDLEGLYNACRKVFRKHSDAPELIQHTLGPALVILGTPATTDYFAPKLLPEIKRQAALITAAETSECPRWLDYRKDDRNFKLDYRLCKPVSFYSGNPALENYYRAVRWLQMVPLRASNDKELAAWAFMTDVANPDWGTPDFQRSFTGLGNFAGPLDERGIVTNNPQIMEPFHLPGMYDKQKPALLRTALLDAALHGTELAAMRLYVMPAHALPDAIILQQSIQNGTRPNGLTVAAFLGSDFAHERMPKIDTSTWNEWIARARLLKYPQEGAPRSLYVDYLDLLRTLNAPPVKEAPAFMRSLPWQIKTCQTQLSSWAQTRHTVTLLEKTTTSISGGGVGKRNPPPGFIEPNPAFWREYVRLIERTIALLEEETAFESSNVSTGLLIAGEIRRSVDKLESFGLHLPEATLRDMRKVEEANIPRYHDAALWLSLMNYEGPYIAPREYKTAQEMQADYKRIITWLRTAADKAERGEVVAIREWFPTLRTRWRELATLARQLESILDKQLAEIELTEAERTIIVSIGGTLAQSMGLFGNSPSSGSSPRHDTAPRWTEVAHDPKTDQSLGVATGRARALYVLYPWRGREVLCTGAVLSYYEEWAPTKRLTDEEWKQKLDSPNSPPPPDWLTPILAR